MLIKGLGFRTVAPLSAVLALCPHWETGGTISDCKCLRVVIVKDLRICRSMVIVLAALCSVSEFRSCVKVEVAVLGSPSLTVCAISVDE